MSSLFSTTSRLGVLVALAALAAPQATAAPLFSVAISPSEILLADPNDMMAQHIDSWDSPLLRVIKRSRPFIEIKNNSTAGENLTQFSLSIGDTSYSYGSSVLGAFAKLGTTTPGVGFTVAPQNSNNELLFTLNNGAGLAPGGVFRFQVDIDGDLPGMFIHPDYRMVLFDYNQSDNSDNAVVAARFSGVANPVSLTFQDVPGQTLQYAQSTLRPYSVMEMLEMFEGGPTPTGDPDEPELTTTPGPGSTIDLGMTMAGMGLTQVNAITLTNTGDVGTTIDVTGFMLMGAHAAQFSLPNGFTATSLVGGGAGASYTVAFLGGAAGQSYMADLILKTSLGDVTYKLTAMVKPVPEPTALALCFGPAALGLARRRRRCAR